MDEYEVHETALKQVCKEIIDTLERIEKSGMSDQYLDRLDKLYHTKKDILATWGMEHPEEYFEENMSGARGRSPMTGRYVSREGNSNTSYTDGYSRGYSEAMNQMSQAQGNNGGGNSGHWPMQNNPYYPDQKRW